MGAENTEKLCAPFERHPMNTENPSSNKRSTRPVQVGRLTIGGGGVTVQSMAATRTQDLEATRKQIRLLEAAGADLIRIAVDSRPTWRLWPS